MKNVLASLFVIVSFSGLAQELDKYLKYKEKSNYEDGYVIDTTGTVLTGLVEHAPQDINRKAVFVSKDGTRTIYRPDQLMEFGVNRYRLVSDGKSFYEVLHDGKLIGLYRKKEIRSLSLYEKWILVMSFQSTFPTVKF